MSAVEEIENFLAESRASDPSGEAVNDEIQRDHPKALTSDDAIVIDACDEIYAVIRRKELKLRERWIRLLPILWRVGDSIRK